MRCVNPQEEAPHQSYTAGITHLRKQVSDVEPTTWNLPVSIPREAEVLSMFSLGNKFSLRDINIYFAAFHIHIALFPHWFL